MLHTGVCTHTHSCTLTRLFGQPRWSFALSTSAFVWWFLFLPRLHLYPALYGVKNTHPSHCTFQGDRLSPLTLPEGQNSQWGCPVVIASEVAKEDTSRFWKIKCLSLPWLKKRGCAHICLIMRMTDFQECYLSGWDLNLVFNFCELN